MEKVYLVYCHKGMWEKSTHYLHSICKDLFTAENRKRDLQKQIDLLKLEYFIKTDRDYDKDKLNFSSLGTENMLKVISFEEEFENVKIDTIYIKEEVIC